MSRGGKYIIGSGGGGDISPGESRQLLPFSLLEGRRRIMRAKRITFAFTVYIWTTFGYYAYYTHLHRVPKVLTEEEEAAATKAQEEEPKATQGVVESFNLFAPIRKPTELKVTPENFFEICPSRNPRVVLNTNLDRFEITETYIKYSKEVEHLDVDKVLKDENGDFMFDDRGYPLRKRSYYEQLILDKVDNLRAFFRS